MKNPIIYLALLVLLFFSCKKRELPQGAISDPVFYIQCAVNGVPMKIEAGTDSYALSASYYKDTTNVYVYRADLKKVDCSNGCGYAVSVLFNDVSVTNAARYADSAIRPGKYLFNSTNVSPALFRSTFVHGQPEIPGAVYQWTVNDGVSNKFYSGYKIGASLDVQKTYSVSLSFDNGGCSAVHKNVFEPGNRLQSNISAVKDASGTTLAYTYSSANTGKPPYIYAWEFNDGSADDKSNAATIKHTYLPKPSGFYTTKLTLVDADSNRCVSYYQVPAMLSGGCMANYTSTFSPILESMFFSRITFIVTDPDGRTYSSRDIDQPATSSFEVISVQDYMTNVDGNPTKKIKIKFNCTVKNGGRDLNITDGEAIIAVAHQ